MINTVIIHGQKQDREKIGSLLSAQGNINVLAYGKDAYDALKIVGTLKPDIAIIDNQLDYIAGQDIPSVLKAYSPHTAIVLLTVKISEHQLYLAASNKISGFVYRKTDFEELPQSIKCVFEGGCFFSPFLCAEMLHLFSEKASQKHLPDNPVKIRQAGGDGKHSREVYLSSKKDHVASLSKKEFWMLVHIAEGRDTAKIAEKLNLAQGTVRNYISAMLRKTGVKKRSQLVSYAYRNGIIPVSSGQFRATGKNPRTSHCEP